MIILKRGRSLLLIHLSNSLTVFTMKFKSFIASAFKILKKVCVASKRIKKILKKLPETENHIPPELFKSFTNKRWLEAEAEGKYNRRYENDYKRRNNLNEFVIDSLCEIRDRHKKDGHFDDNAVIHLYRLLSLKYRVENPLITKPHGKIDNDINFELEKDLVKAIRKAILASNEFYIKKEKNIKKEQNQIVAGSQKDIDQKNRENGEV